MALNLADIIGTEAIPFSGTSLNTTCTVPSGCGAILAFFKRYSSGTTATLTLTIGGNSATDSSDGTSNDDSCVFARLFPGLSAGSQAVVASSLASQSSSTTTDLILVYLSTDVSSTAFRAKNALPSGASQTSTRTFTLSGLTAGDLVIQFDANSDSGSNTPPALPSGWTDVYNFGVGSSPGYCRASAIVAAGTSQACASQANLNWSVLAGVALQEAGAPSGPSITNVSDTTLQNGQTGIVITGTGFGASQGAGSVRIGTSSSNPATGAVTQAVTAWADTSITITAVRGSLALNTDVYLFVTDNAAASNATGSTVQFVPVQIFPPTRLRSQSSAVSGSGAVT